MNDTCEQCGKEIIAPNFTFFKMDGIFDEQSRFCECARCHLDLLIDQYNEFKDEISDINFHVQELTKINYLIIQLSGGNIFE